MTGDIAFAGCLPMTRWVPPQPILERLIVTVEYDSLPELREICEEWFEIVSATVSSQGRAVLDGVRAQPVVIGYPGPPGALREPWGEPGSWLGRGWVARWGRSGGLVDKNLGWIPDLPKKLAEAVASDAHFGRLFLDQLDEGGRVPLFPVMGGGQHLLLEAERMHDLPGVAKFTTSVAESELTGPDARVVQQRWLAVVEGLLPRWRIRWGGLDLSHNNFTLLEETVPKADDERDTLRANEWIRGFGWVTCLSANQVRKAGGISGLADSHAFARVLEAAGGGAVLVATQDYRDYYRPENVAAVQHALRAVIAPGPRKRPPRLDPSHPAYDEYNEYALDRSLAFDAQTGALA